MTDQTSLVVFHEVISKNGPEALSSSELEFETSKTILAQAKECQNLRITSVTNDGNKQVNVFIDENMGIAHFNDFWHKGSKLKSAFKKKAEGYSVDAITVGRLADDLKTYLNCIREYALPIPSASSIFLPLLLLLFLLLLLLLLLLLDLTQRIQLSSSPPGSLSL